MALQLSRGNTRNFVKMIATSFAVMAIVLQPLLSLNIPAAFATPGNVQVKTTNLATGGWYMGETRPAGNSTIVDGGLNVSAVPSANGNHDSKAAGYHAANFKLSDAGNVEIDIAPGSAGVLPGLQLAVSRDGTTPDGYLVYEPSAYGVGNFWTSKTDYGVPAGLGYPSMGTLAQYSAANPSAVVTAVGYSLGSGVVGNSVITKLTAGGTDYTFDTVKVAVNTRTNKQFETLQAAIDDSTTLTGDTISLTSDIITTQQTTISKAVTIKGNGHTVSTSYSNTANSSVQNSVFNIQADGTVLNNVVIDGASKANLHGINVWSDNAIINVALNSVTVQNNTKSGLNVGQNSHVTVANITTKNNSWDGIDVDKANSMLTMNGVNSHNEAGPDIKVDDKTVGQVIDNSLQYGVVDVANNGVTMRLYNLMLAAPVIVSPADNSHTSNNKFDDVFTKVTGAAKYEYETLYGGGSYYTDMSTGGNYDLTGTNVVRHNGASPDATYSWRVRAIDSFGVVGQWSAYSHVTIDTKAPAAPKNLSWTTNTGIVVANNGATNVYSGTASWSDSSSSSNVDHYVYKYWNDIALNPYKVGNESTVSTTSKSHSGAFDQGQGVHHFCVEAVDAAGNASTCTEFTVTYDSAAPSVSNITITPTISNNIGGTVTVTFDVNDQSGVDLTKSRVLFSDGPNTANQLNESPKYVFQPVPGTANTYKAVIDTKLFVKGNFTGNYNLAFTVYDTLGNHGSTKPTDFSRLLVDNSGPTSTLTSSNNNVIVRGTQRFTFTVADDTGVLSGYINFNGPTVKQQALTHGFGNEWYADVNTAELTDGGTYRIDARFIDSFGTARYGASKGTVTIDNTAPKLTINDSYVANGDGTYTISGTSNDNSSPVVVTVGSVTLKPVTPLNGVWKVITTGLDDGEYVITASSKDATGNMGMAPSSTQYFSTPISPDKQKSGILPKTEPRGANTADTAVFPAAQVGQTTPNAVNDQAVKGVNTTRKDTNGNKASMLGFAWYWWIAAALAAALAWWLIAARRRRSEEE